MKSAILRSMSRPISFILAIVLLVSFSVIGAYADEDNTDPIIVVSLGDSYSSGEGIPPFYGQQKSDNYKVRDANWVAHRSSLSWPSLLKVPTADGGKSLAMSNYHVDVYQEGETSSDPANYEWFFVAASGATTKNFKGSQEKTIKRYGYDFKAWLYPQLNVFDEINGTVDYVTFTIGGNDVGFSNIITECATGSTYLGTSKLQEKLAKTWSTFYSETRSEIKQAYKDVEAAAGTQAAIIVAGYPKLLDRHGKGFLISESEATQINEAVTKFNNELEALVSECYSEGMRIYYANVEDEFDSDGGHGAYSSDAWINPILLVPQNEDISSWPPSAYSVHPNATGARHYAKCVNDVIEEAYNDRMQTGTLSGKICKASDRATPVTGANIAIYKNDNLYTTLTANGTGNYTLTLPIGDYRIEITADGYVAFTAYASVTENHNTYMETFLLVEGSENETGVASGRINSAMTGDGIEEVSLSIRKGWNNTEAGEVVATTTTASDGSYSVDLPLGNYTMYATKAGYIPATVNIIVQEGTTGAQNGTMTPIISGDSFRIVLTWGKNPRDLDSHVVGTVSNGDGFHVYYSNKSRYDGDVEVCNLDVDDTTSYGPETITLNTTTEKPYYYYIHRYAGSGTVASSGAQIKVYQGENLVATFNVPTDQGDGDYWNVFAIVNGELMVKNTITSSADTGYASTEGRMRLMRIAGQDALNDKDDKKEASEEYYAVAEQAETETEEVKAAASQNTDESADETEIEETAQIRETSDDLTQSADEVAVDEREDEVKSEPEVVENVNDVEELTETNESEP